MMWRDLAACRDMDTAVFFPENGDSREALAVCATCPVTAECKQEGRDNKEHGVWGGETETQRLTATMTHGGTWGYKCGCRCVPCCTAQRLSNKRSRARRRAS